MAKPSKEILTRRLGPVTVVTIARPHVRNALDRAASRALAEAFEQFEGDEEARVAVLHGEGGSFCAGADLKELAEGHVYEPWATSDFGPTRHGLQKPADSITPDVAFRYYRSPCNHLFAIWLHARSRRP